jgi:hypothetical protein
MEAKKFVEITALRAHYYDKQNKTTFNSSGRSKRTTVDSDEMGDLNLTEERVTIKAGEKKEIQAYFEVQNLLESHYIEITGNVDAPCPADMEIVDCMEKQRKEAEANPKEAKIYLLQRIKEAAQAAAKP